MSQQQEQRRYPVQVVLTETEATLLKTMMMETRGDAQQLLLMGFGLLAQQREMFHKGYTNMKFFNAEGEEYEKPTIILPK